MNNNIPCTPDCPKRSYSCRLTCNKYKVYHYCKIKEYKKRISDRITEEYMIENSCKISEKMRLHKKFYKGGKT